MKKMLNFILFSKFRLYLFGLTMMSIKFCCKVGPHSFSVIILFPSIDNLQHISQCAISKNYIKHYIYYRNVQKYSGVLTNYY